jgi:hypothetical protein
LKVNLGDGDVKRRKDEYFEWVGVIVCGRIPGMEQCGREVEAEKYLRAEQ